MSHWLCLLYTERGSGTTHRDNIIYWQTSQLRGQSATGDLQQGWKKRGWPERAASHRLQISTTSFWEDRTVGLTVTQLPDRMHFWDFRLLQIRFLTYLIRFSLLDWPGVNCWSKYRISILPFLKLYKQFCSQNLNPCAPMWNWDQLRDVNRSSVINESTVLQFLKLDGLYTSYSTTKLWDT